MKILPFLKTVSRDLKIAAVMPSSRYAVREILRCVPGGVRNVIEYGSGDGAVTRGLLEILPDNGRLVAFETNPELFRETASIDDSRLTVIRGDATHASEFAGSDRLPQFDLVVSGIPFSMMSAAERDRTVRMTWELLRPGGVFLVYQVSPLMMPYLKRRFVTQMRFEPLNVPPYFIMRGVKA